MPSNSRYRSSPPSRSVVPDEVDPPLPLPPAMPVHMNQVVHWAWHPDGWASPSRGEGLPLLAGCGAADFAGSGVVHMVGGTAALVAAHAVKARRGRFARDGSVRRLPQQSPALQTLGTLILWVGWCEWPPDSLDLEEAWRTRELAGSGRRGLVWVSPRARTERGRRVTQGGLIPSLVELALQACAL